MGFVGCGLGGDCVGWHFYLFIYLFFIYLFLELDFLVVLDWGTLGYDWLAFEDSVTMEWVTVKEILRLIWICIFLWRFLVTSRLWGCELALINWNYQNKGISFFPFLKKIIIAFIDTTVVTLNNL